MSRALRLRFAIGANQEEAFSGWWWSVGALGVELDGEVGPDGVQRGWVYFAAGDAPGAASRAALTAWSSGAELGEAESVPERDWLEPWRAGAQPIEIGRGFVVDPREPEEIAEPHDPGARHLLRLPARTAFGVGSHESTRLALELLEATGCAGRRVLDVGCGTGILAFAAHVLGAREVVALDIDPAAALLVPQYRALNGWPPIRVFAGSLAAVALGGVDGESRRFDLAVVNVVPSEIGQDLPRLAACLSTRARALFSGILRAQEHEAARQLESHGFRPVGRREEGEWLALATELAA